MRKCVIKQQFSPEHLNCTTQQDLKKARQRLADDLKQRCHAEHVCAVKDMCGDSQKIENKVKNIKQSLIRCYQGDHSTCRRHTYKCNGSRTRNWIMTSKFIRDPNFKMNLDAEGLAIFHNSIEKRLGKDVLEKTIKLMNTQKCEATNRAISASCPKNVTYSRNHVGQVNSAVKRTNRGSGQAIMDQLGALGIPMNKKGLPAKGLRSRQNAEKRRKDYVKSPKARCRRAGYIRKMQRLYDETSPNSPMYKTAMLLKTPPMTDHKINIKIKPKQF